MQNFKHASLVEKALEEDDAYNDITTKLLSSIITCSSIHFTMLAKEEMIFYDADVSSYLLSKFDATVEYLVAPGQLVNSGEHLIRGSCSTEKILGCERVILNFAQHLSGVASATGRFVELIKGTKAKIFDTRKTSPGLRAMEKEAVRAGGGFNHRSNLGNAILIKDNHIAACGGDISRIVKHMKQYTQQIIEIECETIEQVEIALNSGVDIIMLDNMSAEQVNDSVEKIRSKNKNILIEVSGGINEDNVRSFASAGVDRISIGAITHSVRARDISMEMSSRN